MELINTFVSEPHSDIFKSDRNNKAECRQISCSNKNNCDLYKRKQCLYQSTFTIKCPYGQARREYGFTKKARAYYSWISERKDKYKDTLRQISSPDKKMSLIGDYIWLPYSYMDMNHDIKLIAHGGFLSNGVPLIKREDFTLENIIKILRFRPQAMMGGEIASYQKEEVPKFINHLFEVLPDIFNEVDNHLNGELSTKINNFNHVGRTALLSTINPGIVYNGKDIWQWDGVYLTSHSKIKRLIWWEVNIEEIKIKPNLETTYIKITNNLQVNNNTIFKD